MNFVAFFNGFWFYSILSRWSTWQWVFLDFSQNFSFLTPLTPLGVCPQWLETDLSHSSYSGVYSGVHRQKTLAPGLRAGILGRTSQLDSNVFEHCDMDRNGLTWNEVSSCIVGFFLCNFDELKKYLALLLKLCQNKNGQIFIWAAPKLGPSYFVRALLHIYLWFFFLQARFGHLYPNLISPTEEDFEKYDVDGDYVLSFRECTMSVFQIFCPAIESSTKPIAHMFNILKTKLLAKKLYP